MLRQDRNLTAAPGIPDIAYSHDGRWLALGSGDLYQPTKAGEVKILDALTGKELLSLKGHSEMVDGVAFSPDGRRLVSASRDGTVKVWHTSTGQQLLSLKSASRYVCGLAFSSDGRRIAAGNWHNSVNIWQAGP